MKLTKRNHYNPCFWTALWNESYYQQVVSGIEGKKSPRAKRSRLECPIRRHLQDNGREPALRQESRVG